MDEDTSVPFHGRLARIQVTSPEVELRHYISDEELDLLCEAKAGGAKDICLASLGGFLGSIVPAAEQAMRFNSSTNPMGIIGLFSCLLAMGTLTASIVSAVMWKSQAKRQMLMQNRIRSRPKYDVK